MHEQTTAMTDVILEAARKAREETSGEPEPHLVGKVDWPIQCTVGPGLEGAIAAESKIGYVNGAKGWLVYRGYDIFDLAAHSTYEEVCHLLLIGSLPGAAELDAFKNRLNGYLLLNKTMRMLMGFPVETMNAMGALRLGTNLMRQEFTYRDREEGRPATDDAIGADEDSIAMETAPGGGAEATFRFGEKNNSAACRPTLQDACGMDACLHLIAGVSTITAAIARVHQGHMAIEPDPGISHAANFLYMMTGRKPTPLEERIMDVALILHADHGMNASTFAAMVVASTLSDVYFSVGSGIGALNGPLHGGANEQVVVSLEEIGGVGNVKAWVDAAMKGKRKIMGFGHRVYKAYDPRARILGPLAAELARENAAVRPLYETAHALEEEVLSRMGAEKKLFPNVDFYSGIVYSSLGIPREMFTPIFAVSRVAGWTARVQEYLTNNRIFRPRAVYTGEFNKRYVPVEERR
ncbi:MAG TPA: citrate/2-methylcitrate synthase [Polyangia bacterium]|nr:citrate/2-methylcitrate synthase [Polyangia bacterium]